MIPSFPLGLKNKRRLCVHTITTKPWSIEEAIDQYHKAGIGGISVWRHAIKNKKLETVRKKIISADLTAVSLVRGGFFTAKEKNQREQLLDDNKKTIDECSGIGASMVVLVCGATPGLSINQNIDQIKFGIEAMLVYAEKQKVKLAIEPLHPMYADTRSAVTTLKMANTICDDLNSQSLGVAVDVFHVWWDPDLETEIKRCAKNRKLFAYHLCDWKINMNDMLNDRGLMGEGIIDLKSITGWMRTYGFSGFHEVEIFSNHWWSVDQKVFLNQIIQAYQENC